MWILYFQALGTFIIAFGLLWGLFVLAAGALGVVLARGDERVLLWNAHLIKLLRAYLAASLVALTTMVAVQRDPNISTFYTIISGFMLGFWLLSSSAENLSEARQSGGYWRYRSLWAHEEASWLIALAIYVLVLHFPPVALLPATKPAVQAVYWVVHLPVIGWILGLYGLWTILGMASTMGCAGIMWAFAGLYAMFAGIFALLKSALGLLDTKKPGSRNSAVQSESELASDAGATVHKRAADQVMARLDEAEAAVLQRIRDREKSDPPVTPEMP